MTKHESQTPLAKEEHHHTHHDLDECWTDKLFHRSLCMRCMHFNNTLCDRPLRLCAYESNEIFESSTFESKEEK